MKIVKLTFILAALFVGSYEIFAHTKPVIQVTEDIEDTTIRECICNKEPMPWCCHH